MERLSILNSRDLKHIREQLVKQFGFTGKLPTPLLQNPRGKLYLSTPQVGEIPLEKLPVSSIGCYIIAINKDKSVRLSVEGTQLLGPYCEHHVVALDNREFRAWMLGIDLNKEAPDGYVVIKHKEDYAGCGFSRDGFIKSQLSKQRRVHGEAFT